MVSSISGTKLFSVLCRFPLRQLFSEPIDQALDPLALLIVDTDELDSHAWNLVRIVDFVHPGYSAREIERKRSVRQGDDQSNRRSHRQRIGRVDEDSTARDVRCPVGD